MAYIHGKNTSITVGGSAVKAKTSTFKRSRDSHDSTGYGDDGHTFEGGLTNGTFTMGGVYDSTASTGNIAVLESAWADSDSQVDMVAYPEGNSSTHPKYTFTGVPTSLEFSDPVDNLIQWTAEFQISGAVTPGVVS